MADAPSEVAASQETPGTTGTASREGRTRGAHRAPQRTRQSRGRIVAAGTASLAGISALLTGLALSPTSEGAQAGEATVTGTTPTAGIGNRTTPTDPVLQQASRDSDRRPLAEAAPMTIDQPGTTQRWISSRGENAGGGDRASARSLVDPPGQVPATVAGPAAGTGGAGIESAGNTSAAPVQPDTTQPPTAGTATAPTDRQPASAGGTTGVPGTTTVPPGDSGTQPDVVDASPTPGPDATTGSVNEPATDTATAPEPAATGSTPSTTGSASTSASAHSQREALRHTVVEVYDQPPVWPHSRR